MIIDETNNTNSIMANFQQNEKVNVANDAFTQMLRDTSRYENEEKDISNDPRYVQEKSNKEIIENMQKLFEDIKSVYKTGLTVEELEQLEKMLEQIKEEMSKEPMDKKKVREMLDELEKEIAKFQKAIKGEAIVDAEDAKEEGITTSASNIENRLEEAQKDIKELKETVAGSNTITYNYQSSELLQEIKKFQGK